MIQKLILAVFLLAVISPALAENKPSVPSFGDWGKACEKGRDDDKGKQSPEICYIFQNVSNKNNDELVMQMRIGMAPQNGKPVLIVTLPLGVLLPPGTAFVVDGHEKASLKLPFLTCAPEGCTTIGQVIDDKLLNAMKKARKATMRVALLNHQVLTLPVSLKGFTRAYIALNKK